MLYSGQTQLLTPAGVLPLGFEIEASTLEEAMQKFPEGVKDALEQAIDEARELRREAASRIVVPEVGAAASGPGAGRAAARSSFPEGSHAALWSGPRRPLGAALLAACACTHVPEPFPGPGPGGKPMRTATETAVGLPPAASAPIYPFTGAAPSPTTISAPGSPIRTAGWRISTRRP